MFHQIQLDHFGPPDQVVRCIECPELGPPSAWEVVVDVFAFPINVADIAMLAGRYGSLPKPPAQSDGGFRNHRRMWHCRERSKGWR